MLPAHLVAKNGLKVIKEDANLITNIYRDVGDLDVAGAYPNNGSVYNISRSTTSKELIDIAGVDEYTRRMMGINMMSGGFVNSVEVCCNIFKTPTMFEFLTSFKEHLAERERTVEM